MRPRRHLARARSDESGSALVFALVVVLMIGALLAAALDFASFGLGITPKVRADRNSANYVQGSVEAAIEDIRYSSETGRGGTSCTFDDPTNENRPDGTTLPGGAGPFTVECDGQGSDSEAGADAPRYAILALSDDPAEGIRQIAGNNELTINGGIYSHGTISVVNLPDAKISVIGTALSEKGCTARVTTLDPDELRCTGVAHNTYADPLYKPALDLAAPTATVNDDDLTSLISTSGADPLPTCPGSGQRIEFQPGYYGVRPDVLVSRVLPTCSADVWHFNPGVYYFDYPGIWDLGPKRIIGGAFASGFDNNDQLGATCDENVDGVQFIFGAASQVRTQSSSGSNPGGMELCGPGPSHTRLGAPQRIAVYGLSSNGTATVSTPGSQNDTLEAPVTAPPTVATSGGSVGWLIPEQMRAIDEPGPPLGVVTLTSNSDASLDWGTIADVLPVGASVSSVKVRLEHALTGQVNANLVLTSGSTVITQSASGCTACEFDVTTALEARDALWRAVNNLTVRYEAEGFGGNATPRSSAVDGIAIDVTFTPPALRAQTGTSTCCFFESANNPNVFVHGTVYTPSARWSVNVHNSGETIFERGVVLRDVAITMSASSKQTSAPFQLPAATPLGRDVLFTGKVAGTDTVLACVRYTDRAPMPGGGFSAFPGYSLEVRRWLYLRNSDIGSFTCP